MNQLYFISYIYFWICFTWIFPTLNHPLDSATTVSEIPFWFKLWAWTTDIKLEKMCYINNIIGKYELLIEPDILFRFSKIILAKFLKRNGTARKSESTLCHFCGNENYHKLFIYSLNMKFDGIQGYIFLIFLECTIDLKSEELVTRFLSIPLIM